MNKFEELINNVIKSEYTIDSENEVIENYVEVYMVGTTTYISFMSKQHLEEFLRYHGDMLDDDIIVTAKNLKVADITYKRKFNILKNGEDCVATCKIEDRYKYIEAQSEKTKELENILEHIDAQIITLHNEANNFDKFSTKWTETMAKIAPLTQLYNHANMLKNQIISREEECE